MFFSPSYVSGPFCFSVFKEAQTFSSLLVDQDWSYILHAHLRYVPSRGSFTIDLDRLLTAHPFDDSELILFAKAVSSSLIAYMFLSLVKLDMID